jgi:glycosyltransferase involved in cell wall biosynthesis
MTGKFFFRKIKEISLAWMRSGPAQSLLLQRVYGWLESSLGWVALKRGRPFRAVDHFCKVSRRVKTDTLSRRRARANLKAFFQSLQQPESSDEILADFLRTRYARALRSRFLRQPFPLNVTLRGTLLPLKAYDPGTGEKGVLILTYNYLFQAFHSVYRTEELRRYYWAVLEPSDPHIEDPGYALFGGWRVVLEAGNPVVRSGLRRLGDFFEPLPLSSSDWTDPDTFCPLPDKTKAYDLIMVATWSRNKQHLWLFRTLAQMRRPLRVALVGAPWERRREAVVAEAKKCGVSDRIEIYERIPPEEVNRLLNSSRVNLFLSRREGGSRALYEAMFADVPSIVYRNCQGLDQSCVNEQTGVLVDDGELGDAILEVLQHRERFSPRAWAMEHTGYARSTRILNDKLKELSLGQGEPWTTDIAAKVNRPELCYKLDQDAERLRPTLDHLAQLLRPDRR